MLFRSLLNAKPVLSHALEHHCLSYCALEDIGALMLSSRGQRGVVAHFLKHAQTLFVWRPECYEDELAADEQWKCICPPVVQWNLAITACLRVCRNLHQLRGRTWEANEVDAWLPDLIARNAATLRRFELEADCHQFTTDVSAARFLRVPLNRSMSQVAFALASCTRLEHITGEFLWRFSAEGEQGSSLVDMFIANCRRIKSLDLSGGVQDLGKVLQAGSCTAAPILAHTVNS